MPILKKDNKMIRVSIPKCWIETDKKERFVVNTKLAKYIERLENKIKNNNI